MTDASKILLDKILHADKLNAVVLLFSNDLESVKIEICEGASDILKTFSDKEFRFTREYEKHKLIITLSMEKK